jgi:glycosyltransferase involved in cell wall biosynthesis
MRILMIMLEGQGGMFQYGALLANALADNNEVFCIVPLPSEPVFSPAVRVTQLPVGDTKRRFLANTVNPARFYSFIRHVHGIKPDVIHFHNPYSPWTCIVMPWLRRYPKVTTIPEGKLHGGMQRRIEMRIARDIHASQSDVLIALCDFDRKQVEGYAHGKPIHVIPHGANTLFLDTSSTGTVKEDSVLFFGGIAPFKGLEYALKAFALVEEQVPDVKLVIAGRGDIRPYRDLLAHLRNVEVNNSFIPTDKTSDYFRRARFLVMPYAEDDHSGVIPIAYAFGKPVVVSDKVCDMVDEGETGLVVPARDHEALALAMLRLLEDEGLRQRMGAAALKKAREELSWERIAAQTSEVYRHAMELRLGRAG